VVYIKIATIHYQIICKVYYILLKADIFSFLLIFFALSLHRNMQSSPQCLPVNLFV